MKKLTALFCNVNLAPDFHFRLPTSSRTIRKMAESVNHQEVHDLLVEVARKAGDMIATAQPHINTSSSKKNCRLLGSWDVKRGTDGSVFYSGRFGHRDG